MDNSGAMFSMEVANVERINASLHVANALREVLANAADEPGLWPRARCQAI